MAISIWRYSHLALAISSSLFIVMASLTGIILAFEPISNQLAPFAIENLDEISIANTVEVLQQKYDEVIEVKVTNDDFVVAAVITKEGDSETFYIDPISGKKLGNIVEKAPIFKFATNLHRSLFLKSTGRFLVGFASLLLLLIAVTGILLIAKRQGGFKRFFSKVVRENFQQYYHIQFGKILFIPLVIITLTGVYLSLEKFAWLPSYQVSHQTTELSETIPEKMLPSDFKLFQNTSLAEVKKIEFPFSTDIEDYFLVALIDKEIQVHQYTGDILSSYEFPLVALASQWSLVLHTGQGSIWWAIVLLLASIGLLFFIYSGFKMTLKRTKKQLIPKNIHDKNDAEFVILVGSETGNTYRFATLFYKALLANRKKVYISTLNTYTSYSNAKHLIVMTSTYGEGEAPSNAKNFEKLLQNSIQKNTIHYSVVGFGSLLYPEFCKYAVDIDAILKTHGNFESIMPICKINNQSFTAFQDWAKQWGNHTKIPIKIEKPKVNVNLKKLRSFSVVKRSELNEDDTFLIRLKPTKKQKFQSGDLLSFYPESDLIARQYSIGKINNDIVLSVKKHEFGICSTYLSQLATNAMVKAKIQRNYEFHFPKYADEIVMIANGTGIGPFLGMINENQQHKKLHLFWGTRTKASVKVYKDILDNGLASKKLTSLHIAYSQETATKYYVQDVMKQQQNLIANVLKDNGVIMICGAVAMQNQVLNLLDTITRSKLELPLSEFESMEQLKMDCY
ncbi:PepSY domain-containing protein [uncultured Kordia sp.]|uniref:PepSY domain-containing protein n=1 Tax=uncultured Kordia sp. TaxID=507699 RepID=UPI00261544D8|nr:PepSY domain-containing protein [uncultured Kordia sp.]